MTSYSRGDVVLVPFVFTDESAKKLRPAVIVSSTNYNRRRHEVIISAITSNVARQWFGDQPIADWKTAGLIFPSLATAILRTIKRSMIVRKLGSLTKADLSAIDSQMRQALALP